MDIEKVVGTVAVAIDVVARVSARQAAGERSMEEISAVGLALRGWQG